jgi:hypothetical protein
VFPKVAEEFDEGRVDALRPGVQASGRGCGQRLFQRAHRLAQLGAAHPQRLEGLSIRG